MFKKQGTFFGSLSAQMDSSRQALQTNRNPFQIRFWINGRKQKNIETNSESWILIKVQYVIHKWIRLDMLYKLLTAFFKFRTSFRIIGRKTKNIQTNTEAWILIKVPCDIYQWICLDMLYKLMKAFFKFRNHFLN